MLLIRRHRRCCFLSIFLSFFHSLCLRLSYCRFFVSFVGIQITTIFNTIPELECFRYVYLVVLSCVLKRKSSIFRFVVIGIMDGGFECNKNAISRSIYLHDVRMQVCIHVCLCESESVRAVARHTTRWRRRRRLYYCMLCVFLSLFHIDSWIYTSKLHGLIFILLDIIIIYAVFEMPNWMKWICLN